MFSKSILICLLIAFVSCRTALTAKPQNTYLLQTKLTKVQLEALLKHAEQEQEQEEAELDTIEPVNPAENITILTQKQGHQAHKAQKKEEKKMKKEAKKNNKQAQTEGIVSNTTTQEQTNITEQVPVEPIVDNVTVTPVVEQINETISVITTDLTLNETEEIEIENENETDLYEQEEDNNTTEVSQTTLLLNKDEQPQQSKGSYFLGMLIIISFIALILLGTQYDKLKTKMNFNTEGLKDYLLLDERNQPRIDDYPSIRDI